MIKLLGLHKKHVSTRGFVFGTGMSVSILLDELKFPVALLTSEIVIGCKQTYRRVPLRYWVSMDPSYYRREKAALAGTTFLKFVPTDALDPGETEDATVVALPRLPDTRSPGAIPISFDDLRTDGDTGLAALRIAYLLGLNPIYLVGLADRIWKERMHFHTESKRIVSDAVVQAMGSELLPFVQAITADGVRVISCSSISNLNTLVPYVDIRALDMGVDQF
jgi:hypothetical protein